jgi:hypothetical protein
VRARTDAAAVALATDGLECLRAGPRADAADAPTGADGTRFARTLGVTAGRGRPDRLAASVRWGGHGLTLASEAWP